ncbi:MAG: phytoene desaturase family protein [Coriobacteriia bacterium]
MADYDVVVIGAGHTGLMTAALLAKEGKSVLVVEKNGYVGGIASNAYDIPGYTHNRGAWYLMFARLDWMEKEFELKKNGLELICPETPGVVMAGAGKGRIPYRMFADPAAQMEAIGQDYGPEVVKQFIEFYKYLAPFNQAMDFALLNEPISLGAMMDMLPTKAQEVMAKIFYGDVKSLVDEFFPDKEKTAAIRSQMMGLGTDGFYGGVQTPGSALTLAYHACTPEEGSGGSPYRFPKGHIGQFSEALANCVRSRGGEVRLNSQVVKILSNSGKVTGVKLIDGSEVSCDILVSSCDPYNNYIRLMDESQTDPFLREQALTWKTRCTREHIAQGYLAINKVPTFSDEFAHLNEGGWRFSVWDFDEDEGEKDWDAVKHGKLGQYTFATGYYMPSMMDPSLAPAGKHTMTICAQYAWPLDLPLSRYEQQKEETAEMMIRSYERYMPDFRDCVDEIVVGNPVSWEEEYHVAGGTWTHGMVQIYNMFNLRPFPGHSNYRGGLKGMYLCGTSNHPGPGITGSSAQNCYNAIKADGK